ncbi:isochorismate synthase [Actinomarinicola tropica]|nr:isochorismate synthase [Actinomarinicola tropica]
MAERPYVARTRRLDRDVDLVAFAGGDGHLFEREGLGLAGRGELLRIDVPPLDPAAAAAATSDAFDRFEVDDEVGSPGCGPVAFGAFPFDPAEPRTLVVPRVVVGRAEDGTRWITTTARRDEPAPDPSTVGLDLVPPAESEVDPGAIVVRAARPAADWCAALADGRDRLRDGELTKFVFAREVVVETERPLPRSAILRRLRAGYPSCYITSVGAMVGASPELLLSRRGDVVRSRPMAGTAPRSPDPAVDARLAAGLLASSKDRHEHQIVIDMIHDALLPWCSYLDAEPEPSVLGMANVQHLATYLEGRLSAPAASAVELVTALHPTPAICGTPTDRALEVIRELEGLERGAYAGPVGWLDAEGNGDWAVGIRSAELVGTRARVFAGVGVVADSDPEAELAETRSKLQAMLSALLRP